MNITKQGGSLEAFSAAKLKRCVAAAMRSCDCDPRLADPLVQAVEMHLGDWSGTRPPTSDYVHECVRAALTQTGLAEVAEDFAAHHRRRKLRRSALRVCDRERPHARTLAWRKQSVIETLRERCGLSPVTARILAAEIEIRALSLDCSVISTALIRELLEIELLNWGLAGETVEPARQRPCADPVGSGESRKEE